MTPAIYRAHLARLGLTQEAAGVFFGGSARTGQRWAAEGPPLPVAMLLHQKLTMAQLEKLRAAASMSALKNTRNA
jgi:hypothetical protein